MDIFINCCFCTDTLYNVLTHMTKCVIRDLALILSLENDYSYVCIWIYLAFSKF